MTMIDLNTLAVPVASQVLDRLQPGDEVCINDRRVVVTGVCAAGFYAADKQELSCNHPSCVSHLYRVQFIASADRP